jgi:ATP-binding cassette subfamily B protein
MAQSRLSKLGSYLRPYWRQTTLGIVALFVVNAVNVRIPLVIRSIIDNQGDIQL